MEGASRLRGSPSGSCVRSTAGGLAYSRGRGDSVCLFHAVWCNAELSSQLNPGRSTSDVGVATVGTELLALMRYMYQHVEYSEMLASHVCDI
jgi:hypothetical protein